MVQTRSGTEKQLEEEGKDVKLLKQPDRYGHGQQTSAEVAGKKRKNAPKKSKPSKRAKTAPHTVDGGASAREDQQRSSSNASKGFLKQVIETAYDKLSTVITPATDAAIDKVQQGEPSSSVTVKQERSNIQKQSQLNDALASNIVATKEAPTPSTSQRTTTQAHKGSSTPSEPSSSLLSGDTLSAAPSTTIEAAQEANKKVQETIRNATGMDFGQTVNNAATATGQTISESTQRLHEALAGAMVTPSGGLKQSLNDALHTTASAITETFKTPVSLVRQQPDTPKPARPGTPIPTSSTNDDSVTFQRPTTPRSPRPRASSDVQSKAYESPNAASPSAETTSVNNKASEGNVLSKPSASLQQTPLEEVTRARSLGASKPPANTKTESMSHSSPPPQQAQFAPMAPLIPQHIQHSSASSNYNPAPAAFFPVWGESPRRCPLK